MIEVNLATAFLLYLTVTLTGLFGIWIWSEWRGKTKEIVLPERLLIECEYCKRTYLKEASKKITQCPECSSYNK
jgi:ribosomal protein L37AE/L43A